MTRGFEPFLLVLSIAAVLIVVWRMARARRAMQDDATHLGRLLGKSEDEDAGASAARPAGALERRLRSAGLEVSPLAAIVAFLLIALVVMLAMVNVSARLIWAAPLGAIVALWAIASLLTEAARQRSWRFENRLADAIDLIVGALSAGLAPADAIANAAEASLEPVRGELREVASALRNSVPIDHAVARMQTRYDSESVRLFSQLLIAKWETGGPLAPALQAVARTMRQGLRLRGQLRAHISGAQTGAIVMALIPYLLIAFFIWTRPQSLALVWNFAWGPPLFAGAILLQIAGFAWLRHILRIEL